MTIQPPVLYAHRDRGHLIVWCPHCRREHHHGVCSRDPSCPAMATHGRRPCTCSPGAGDGHRVAHCPPGSPWHESGYVLREVRTADADLEAAEELAAGCHNCRRPLAGPPAGYRPGGFLCQDCAQLLPCQRNPALYP